MKTITIIGLTGLMLSGMTGCNSNNNKSDNIDQELSEIIKTHNLSSDASNGRDIPSIQSAKAQLGMQLFFTTALGGDQDTACVSCHHPALGGGDDLSLPIGVGADSPALLGPGRSSSGSVLPTVPRNAPTTFNIALWDQVMFHDGRIESLSKVPGRNGSAGGIRTPDSAFSVADENAGDNLVTAQARFPVTSEAEMRGTAFEAGQNNNRVRGHLSERLAGLVDELANPDVDGSGKNDWQEQFETVYKAESDVADLITYERIADAIAAYESSQVFVASPWARYVGGEKHALTSAQKNGARLFFTGTDKGGAGCSSCHRGDFFTDEKFHNIAMIQFGEGKGDGSDGDDDFGRFRETKELADRYAFRTPTLLNVEVTGPYGHTGAYDTLEGIIRHHLNPQNAVDDFFASNQTWCNSMNQFRTVADCDVLYPNAEKNTRAALSKLSADQVNGLSGLKNGALNSSDIADLVSFMQALTDPCVKDAGCIGQWIPDVSQTGAGGQQLNAVDNNSQPLIVN
ncbi:MAG: cytochrome-c peroxidase [Saccharospirillaceae bacterium]|nr:cytochrome-c peroxidase [Saccharospirillaceae bacterium]MCD8532883.1 cytochrome-c peroxidase [Saccharospirillaceae bacterium]